MEDVVMNSKKIALIIGGLLCGYTAFGQMDYLYDDNGLRYDIGAASYTSYGNSICLYNVRVCSFYYTNETYGTAVIFYDGTYGTMKIIRVQTYSQTTPPSFTAIEAQWPGGAGTFPCLTCLGASYLFRINL